LESLCYSAQREDVYGLAAEHVLHGAFAQPRPFGHVLDRPSPPYSQSSDSGPVRLHRPAHRSPLSRAIFAPRLPKFLSVARLRFSQTPRHSTPEESMPPPSKRAVEKRKARDLKVRANVRKTFPPETELRALARSVMKRQLHPFVILPADFIL